MKITRFLPTLALVSLGGFGCATVAPTPHLLNARLHYSEARNGDAQKYEPDLVHDASVALEKAEAAHDRKPGSERERHLAYIADRKALLSTAAAQGQVATASIEDAAAKREQILLAQRNDARNDADQTSLKLGETEAELTQANLEAEALQRELAVAMNALQEIASVKADEKQMVITISGEVLFTSDASSLRPIAKEKLDKVAAVLREQGSEKVFVVKGHTDSQGKDAYNDRLSQERADAVRTYLISQGVDGDRIRARGLGENEPVAKNDSAEGRANNRRVEIVVSDATTTASR